MANAEKLLHEAQFAFQSISFGDTPANKKNASRSVSLCKKIIAKYPGSMEAGEAHAILRRLGEEAYSSKMRSRHIHVPQSTHHQPQPSTPQEQRTFTVPDETEALDWGGLVRLFFTIPKAALWMIFLAGFFLFGLLGPFLFIPLIAFVLFTGPFRQMLKLDQRNSLNELIQRINAYAAERQQ